MPIPENVRRLIESGRLAHLATVGPEGQPQVTGIWVGIEADEIVSGHLRTDQQKLRNVRRNPRVALSIEAPGANAVGMQNYLVIYGTARLTEGGAPELLHRLAQVYVGPGTKFPPMDNPPPGVVMRITPERYGGMGTWND